MRPYGAPMSKRPGKCVAGQEIDLCLIDLTLPDGSGYEVCRLAKEKGDIPVVFLTACDDEVNVVMGVDMGADDYVTKPFRLRELIEPDQIGAAAVWKGRGVLPVLTFGNLRINTMEAKVYKEDEEVFLTALEYRLLLTFVGHVGQVLSRNQLLEGIWDVAGILLTTTP